MEENMFYSTEEELVEDKLEFDKFMKDIVKREVDKENINEDTDEETPQRKYNRLYGEKPGNRIVIRDS
jgi:hypothetical protein